MSETCRYHEARFYVCEAPATHRLTFNTSTGRPLGYVLPDPVADGSERLPQAVFCLRHAGDVSHALQQRWQAAKGQHETRAPAGKRKAA